MESLKPLILGSLLEEKSMDLEPPRGYFAAGTLPDAILPMPPSREFTASLLWEAKAQPTPF